MVNKKEDIKKCTGKCAKKNEAGIVVVNPTDTQSSVKLYDSAGGTRIEVKAYSTNLNEAVAEATKWYNKLKEQYKESE